MGVDVDGEVWKLKALLVAVVVFLISSYYSWYEFRYAVWGQTAQAEVQRVYVTTEFRRRRAWGSNRDKEKLVVEYTFSDATGTQRSERDSVSLNWKPPEEELLVQYLPGVTGISRLSGNSNQFAVWLFLGSLIAMIGGLVWIAQQANPKPRRRRDW
jgi:hypothetical protein